MKKILVALVLSTLSTVLDAQPLRCRVEADSALSSYIAEWISDSTVSVVVVNTSDSVQYFRLEASISYQSKPLASPTLSESQVFQLDPGKEMRIFADQIFSLQRMRYFDKEHIDRRSGMILVIGSVSICINPVDTAGLKGLAEPECYQCFTRPYVMPRLLWPIAADTVTVDQTIQFRWQAVQPRPRYCEYRVRLFDADSEQYVAQVIRTHEPILDTTVADSNTMHWQVPKNLVGKRLVWQIRASNGGFVHYGGTDGYSEPASFTVRGFNVNAGRGGKAESKKRSKTRTGTPKR